MAQRRTLIVSGEIYHIFNRSVGKQPIFLSVRDYQRGLDTIKFYRFERPSLRFSFYDRLKENEKEKFMSELLEKGTPIVEIFCFCLMPNHMHFLLKGLTEHGISQFIGNLQNSYAKYFNKKYKRTGTLFQQNFKAVRIESDEQLMHVSRYIHLNPVTSYLIKPENIDSYEWSSFKAYLRKDSEMVNADPIMNNFKSHDKYRRFVLDQVDYQRRLDAIKHLIME